MKISLQWLREYVAFTLSAESLADRLTNVGFEVESVESVGPSFRGIVVAEVVSVEPHPHAEKLKVCRLNTGTGIRSVVCGAPNVQTGQLVPLAEPGAALDGRTSVQSVMLRGVPSDGMICSERELGLGNDHSGILVLDKKRYHVGQDFSGDAAQRDVVFDVNVTPNRPDCLCHFGIAREVGVIVGSKPSFPEFALGETGPSIEGRFSIRILDTGKCPRYSARLVTDVRIGPSPVWLARRLEAVGMRPINNVVDATNFVMLETGQPLHAFDFELLAGQRIDVRCASDGEAFTTLDGQSHTLTSDDLLICDGKKGVALAGVMGGLNSEVSERTRAVLLESAHFHPTAIRQTAKRLGIASEASLRFERGTDPNGTVFALNRSAQWLETLAGGTVAKGVLDSYPKSVPDCELLLREERLTGLLGTEVPADIAVAILTGLGFGVVSSKPLRITVPTFRRDVQRDVDAFEEIIRHYGYDKIEPKLRTEMELTDKRDMEQELSETVRDLLSGFGLTEVLNNSLVSPKHVSAFCLDAHPVSIQNPLSPENSLLRTSLIPGLLDSIVWNRNRSENNLKLFELGRVFLDSKSALPDESSSLAGVLTGMQLRRPYWNEPNRQQGFFDVKGLVSALLERLHIVPHGFRSVVMKGLLEKTSLAIECGSINLGWLGEIENNVLREWDIDTPVMAFHLDIRRLVSALPKEERYVPIPRYPSVYRDLALVVDETVPVGQLQQAMLKAGGDWLQTVEPFDIYRGQQIASGKKSVAFSLQFSSMDGTLREQDIEPSVRDIVQCVERQFAAALRA